MAVDTLLTSIEAFTTLLSNAPRSEQSKQDTRQALQRLADLVQDKFGVAASDSTADSSESQTMQHLNALWGPTPSEHSPLQHLQRMWQGADVKEEPAEVPGSPIQVRSRPRRRLTKRSTAWDESSDTNRTNRLNGEEIGTSWLHEVRVCPGKFGVDIGGTLAKMVLAFPSELCPSESPLPGMFESPHHNNHANRNLGFDWRPRGPNGPKFSLHFASGTTQNLEWAMTQLRDSGNRQRHKSLRRIVVAGGGAHKYATLFREVLCVEFEPFKEMQALVEGLLFLNKHGPPTELFKFCDGEACYTNWPAQLFPCLLLNMGSGVSVLRIDRPGQYTRVGGTPCGGATFLGLSKLFTTAKTFREALALAAQGDAARVDKLVGDIYGHQGCQDLGMPASHTASNFGKLASYTGEMPAEEDLARALLQMVVQASVVLAKAFALHFGCLQRVFFVGGFLEDNPLAKSTIATNMRSLGGTAYFLEHSDFLGALGSLARESRMPSQEPPSSILTAMHRQHTAEDLRGIHTAEDLRGIIG